MRTIAKVLNGPSWPWIVLILGPVMMLSGCEVKASYSSTPREELRAPQHRPPTFVDTTNGVACYVNSIRFDATAMSCVKVKP